MDTEPSANHKDGLEPVVVLLFGGVMFFTLILLVVAFFRPADGQTFQVVSNALAGVLGAFLMRVKQGTTGAQLTPTPPDQTVTAKVTE